MSDDTAVVRKVGVHILVGVTVLALGYRFIKEDDPATRVPDDAALKSPWACHACGAVHHLTPRQRVRLQRTGSDFTVGGKRANDKTASPKGRTSFRQLILRCPGCGKMELPKAATCPSCKTAFPAKRSAERAKCPRCGWEPPRKKVKRALRGRRTGPRG